ncbi:MAG: hypothetical protein JXP34_12690 [Planctomycetes bacterium]|nr:hypothetical protein [Planctomycetota bacterium]
MMQMILGLMLLSAASPPGEGRFTIPYVSGRPGTQAFAGHPGWVDAYHRGYGPSVWARIEADGSFRLPAPRKAAPICLVAMFDRIETPPVVVFDWPHETGGDVPIPVEYACVPAGYPDAWDREYRARTKNFYQTFVARGTQLYGVTIFDGPKIVEWGNKINVSVHAGSPSGSLIPLATPGPGTIEAVSAGHSDREFPRIGWRHGDMPVATGETYAIRAGGYRSHGGRHFELDAFLRPDAGDGYEGGQAFIEGRPVGADLCALIFGDSHGQIVENHIRSEEWEIFLPYHRPSRVWAQTFLAHGVSLAGITFWAASGGTDPVAGEIRIRTEGPWGDLVKPVKVATGHASPIRPIIRYPDTPAPVPGYEDWYRLPSQLFQIAYFPGELALVPGETYCVEFIAQRPVMLYADGDYYRNGFAYYEGLKVDRQVSGRITKHSERWTIAMNIVTYALPGGVRLGDAPHASE